MLLWTVGVVFVAIDCMASPGLRTSQAGDRSHDRSLLKYLYHLDITRSPNLIVLEMKHWSNSQTWQVDPSGRGLLPADDKVR